MAKLRCLLLVILCGPGLPGQPAPDAPEPVAVPLARVAADDEAHLVARDTATYWLRIPRRLRAQQTSRVLLCLHGLDSNGWNFQHHLVGLGLGEREILLCPNGDRRGPWRHAHRFEPEPVLAALDDLATRVRPEQVYLIGHSQGAWLGYRVLLHAPDRFAGALLAAGGLAGGQEPVRAVEQYGSALPPLLIVHGELDPVVAPTQSDRAYEKFLRAGWPALRYWHPDLLDHDFGGVPLVEGLAWLQQLTPPDPNSCLRSAARVLELDRVADSHYLLARAERLGARELQLRPLRSRCEQRAQRQAKAWLARIASGREPFGTDWYDARAGLETLPEFAAVTARFAEVVPEHEQRARDLAQAARAAAEGGDMAEARRLHQQITTRCSAAFELAIASHRWLLQHR